MGNHVLVWDLETVPDLAAIARVNGFDEGDETGARAVLADKFPKLPFIRLPASERASPSGLGRDGRCALWVHRIVGSVPKPKSSSASWIGSTNSGRSL
jgi:hypothetical protein